ncbi:hypothetical protein EV702DRAFT_1204468 [Suillus placidus]|uniref:Uncharacterized protein n=1 Tax=Suillus placidus TaxID=48579 RepID=A0A9P6ZGX2_9AGAM|nr:hypothetical protein EV702DRAFT_1204468 [Suillus placidus]
MARTKQVSSRATQRPRGVVQLRLKTVHAQHRTMIAGKSVAKSAAKHAAISRALPQPIRDFCIPVTKAEPSMDHWVAREPDRIHYGPPELKVYGQLECLRVPVMKAQQLLGYVPLPTRYESSWVYLCYCVDYWLAIWKCWDGEWKKKRRKTKNTNPKTQQERADLIATCRKNSGARFLQAMVARRTVLEECMANGVNDERIKSLDEFIIRNYRDWLFMEFDELPDDADKYLEADPLHAGNKKLFETGWTDSCPMMLGRADHAWMYDGLDLSELFKKGVDTALHVLKTGGEQVDITHDENAELPDKWHELHEPLIRFTSERKDKFLCDGFTLDEPLVFLCYCMQDDEEIEREDFLREIMDMWATDEARQRWSSHVDQLIDGHMKWDDFSNLVADELGLDPDQRVNSMGPDGAEPDLPFLKLDAKIAVRVYLRNKESNPDTAAAIFRQSINRFADPDANDRRVWNWVMRKVKPDTVTRTLQKADFHRSTLTKGHQGDKSATLTITGHTRDVQRLSPSPSSGPQPTPPAKVMQSDMDVDQADAASRGSSPDTGNNILLDGEQLSAVQTSRVPVSNTMLPSSNAGKNQGDRLTTPSNTPPDHTPDVIGEYQDDSQFTATHEEGDRSTGNDNSIPESLFSLADVEQSITNFIYDGISFNELRNILLTDIPPIHVKTVHEALRTLDSNNADGKRLNALLEKLKVEEALAIRAVDVASMN